MKIEKKKVTVHRLTNQEAGTAIIKALGIDLNTPGLLVQGLADEVHVSVAVADEDGEVSDKPIEGAKNVRTPQAANLKLSPAPVNVPTGVTAIAEQAVIEEPGTLEEAAAPNGN